MRPWQVVATGAAVSAAAAGAYLLYRFDPNVAGSPFPPCIFRALTGYYCPGCGTTRALHALVHLDPARAWRMNPALVLGLAVTPGLIAWKRGWRAAWFAPVVALVSNPAFWLLALPGYWIARNLPWFPFTLLAPG